jgi:hypothetical protein
MRTIYSVQSGGGLPMAYSTPEQLSFHPVAGHTIGLDHGVGHSLLVLCDANAPHGRKWNNFKVLENYLFNVSISLS